MSTAVADLEAGLQAMLLQKPPGVSGSRIQSITSLCVANVQSESVLIQKLYTHFKKAPGTHKLGVLYVVDSVTRKWIEQAKAAQQLINSTAQDGTFAAGVHRVTELLPVLMNDIILSSPNDQKEKIKKLLDIWEKGQTFPAAMLSNFKERLSAQMQNRSTTPPGSPPQDLQKSLGLLPNAPAPTAAATAPNTSSILAALANMARQNNTNPSANNQTKDSLYNVSSAQNNSAPQVAPLNHNLPFSTFPPSVNVPAPAATFAPQVQAMSNGAQGLPNNQTNSFMAMPVVPPPPTTTLDPATIQLMQMLLAQGVTPDQLPKILAAIPNGLSAPQPNAAAAATALPLPQYALQTPNQNQSQNGQNGWGVHSEDSRDRNGFHAEPTRSPPGRFRRRSRSRSPTGWNARDSPARRRDETMFDYERDSPPGGRNRGGDDRGRGRGGRGGGNEYRQRSPQRRGRSPSPVRAGGMSGGQKWVGHDDTIGQGKIKVLSRTLFVGGVTTSESDLRNIFERYGTVQTCIVNKDKRHAFVKMITRQDAVAAKDAMEKNRTPDSSLRTRWGVGFGPRDCSDYQTGVSVIPISKLTDADRKWMLTAEYGGSGGLPIESGMIVEEPDIEIGAGVSSKAISRRMQTDKGGNNGPKSGRDREEPRRDVDEFGRDITLKEKSPAPAVPPPVPAFGVMPQGFPFAYAGMPIFPPGFSLPGQQASQPSQPPPPGRS